MGPSRRAPSHPARRSPAGAGAVSAGRWRRCAGRAPPSDLQGWHGGVDPAFTLRSNSGCYDFGPGSAPPKCVNGGIPCAHATAAWQARETAGHGVKEAPGPVPRAAPSAVRRARSTATARQLRPARAAAAMSAQISRFRSSSSTRPRKTDGIDGPAASLPSPSAGVVTPRRRSPVPPQAERGGHRSRAGTGGQDPRGARISRRTGPRSASPERE